MKAAGRAAPSTGGAVHCPHFGPCGGCTLLDVPYAEEIALKEEALRRMVRLTPPLRDAEILPIVRAAEPLFYRTALKVPFGWTKRDGGGTHVTAGFFRRRSHAIVDLESCAIQHPALTRLLLLAKQRAGVLGVPVYDERRHRGLLRHLVARVAAGTGEVLAGLVVRQGGRPETRALAADLFERGAGLGVVGVVENENARPGNAILGPVTTRLAGRDEIVEDQDGLRVRTSLTSFVQVNAAMARELYREVLALLGPLDGATVVDLYSGFGPIALRLAQAGARVFAIERHPAAAAEGARAAAENGLAGRLTFLAGDAGHGLARLAGERVDAIVVDPPRRGLAEGLATLLLQRAPPRLLYVSCNPDSLARDVERLALRFVARTLRPVDLFPRTDHLELVLLLERRTR